MIKSRPHIFQPIRTEYNKELFLELPGIQPRNFLKVPFKGIDLIAVTMSEETLKAGLVEPTDTLGPDSHVAAIAVRFDDEIFLQEVKADIDTFDFGRIAGGIDPAKFQQSLMTMFKPDDVSVGGKKFSDLTGSTGDIRDQAKFKIAVTGNRQTASINVDVLDGKDNVWYGIGDQFAGIAAELVGVAFAIDRQYWVPDEEPTELEAVEVEAPDSTETPEGSIPEPLRVDSKSATLIVDTVMVSVNNDALSAFKCKLPNRPVHSFNHDTKVVVPNLQVRVPSTAAMSDGITLAEVLDLDVPFELVLMATIVIDVSYEDGVQVISLADVQPPRLVHPETGESVHSEALAEVDPVFSECITHYHRAKAIK